MNRQTVCAVSPFEPYIRNALKALYETQCGYMADAIREEKRQKEGKQCDVIFPLFDQFINSAGWEIKDHVSKTYQAAYDQLCDSLIDESAAKIGNVLSRHNLEAFSHVPSYKEQLRQMDQAQDEANTIMTPAI